MRSTTVLLLSALVTIATASQIQSLNQNFPADHKGCITASSNAAGAPVVIQECLNSGDVSTQNWSFVQSDLPQQIRVFGDKCLDVKDGNNADGTKLQVWTCVDGNTNQQFIPFAHNNVFRWSGTDKCVDLTDGNPANGNQLQIWTCDPNNLNQHWSTSTPPDTSVRIRANGNPTPVCMTAALNVDGGRVSLDDCGSPHSTFPAGDETWLVPAPGSSGPISTFDGKKCLDVTNGVADNGNLVQIWSCAPGNKNQMFKVDGAFVSWAGQNKCLDVKDGVFLPGMANIQIWDCDTNNTNQQFTIQ